MNKSSIKFPGITANRILFPLCFFTLLGCINQSTKEQSTTTATTNEVACKPYFQFDKIDHYFLNIDEEKLWSTEQKIKKTTHEKALLAILIGYRPDRLSDTSILNDIEKLVFERTEIPDDKFNQINEIFCQRKYSEVEASACIAIYRDILVFKKENKIIGTAKLCFSCGQCIITGTLLNTEEFGQSGDYDKLFKILH